MEKFVQRESSFAAGPQNGSPGDMNFNDVFGGPPRRLSIQEVKLRYSFGDAEGSEEEIVSSPWSSVNEKPVFGEEGVPRRRHQKGDDFFDDIFRGEESYGSPRITDRDRDGVFGSSPGSRILSPAKPLPPKSEPFATSIPAQFSLPAKLSKSLEIPTFSCNGQHKMDGGTNGLNSSQSSIPLTRFSSLRTQDEHPGYRQSPLSHGVSLSSEDAPSTVTSDDKENTEKSTKDRRNVNAMGNQFHFSIYKWAGREVPMLFPLVDSKYDRSASSNGRIESKSSTRVMKDRGLSAAGGEALNVKPKRENLRTKHHTKEVQNSIEEKATSQTTEVKSRITANNTGVFGGDRKNIKEKVKSVDDIDVQVKNEKEVPLRKEESLRFELKSIRKIIGGENINPQEKIEKEIPLKIEESLRFELKSLHKFLSDETDVLETTEGKAPLNKEESLESEQKSLRVFLSNGIEHPENVTEVKENKKRISNGIHSGSRDLKTVNGNEQMRNSSKNGVVEGPGLQAAAVNSGATPGGSRVKGKVREFVQIFNQEGDSRSKASFQRSRNSKWKAANGDSKENGVATDATEAKEKVSLHNVAKSDASVKVDENLNKDESQHYSPSNTTRRSLSNQKNGFTAEKFRRDSRIYIENFEDLLEDEFLIQDLTDDHETVPENEDLGDTKAIDAKIRQWSSGKKGNIRSLLSTLQFVLWAESGWKPVPLADLIESNAVKRAYQKALLRLHPDKLQQKGAAFHQEYIAEKVFDILQEAWDQFNTLVPL